MDNRRKSLVAIIVAFMIVTVPHVAIYAGSFEPPGSFWLGWPYSLAVEASIIVCAYFTKWQTTRVIAWVGYFVFVIASGIMNVGYIQPLTFPAWTYALFPTAAISLLGLLYRQVDKLVLVAEAGKRARVLATGSTELAPASQELAPASQELYQCDECPREFSTKQALGAHKRFCFRMRNIDAGRVEINGKH
jgi:hypothetical protein